MSAIEGSLYLLGIAIGLSSAYFDGPFERNINNFRSWRAFWEPLADQVDLGGKLETIEQGMFAAVKPFDKALPILRTLYFASAVFSLWRFLTLGSDPASYFDSVVSRILVCGQIGIAGAFQIFLTLSLSKTRKARRDFTSKDLLDCE